jgi:cytochrome d ubiquinol oxidase subunit I
MAYGSFDAFIPGIKDLIEGNEEQGLIPVTDKVKMGKKAINALAAYKKAKKNNDEAAAAKELEILNANYKYFGYGYFENQPQRLIPSVPMSFYSFHLMVALGGWFLLFFMMMLWLVHKDRLEKRKWWLRAAVVTIPLAYIASQSGWLVAEMGRQPWVIQDLMPTLSAVSNIDATSVQITFWLFAVVFTGLFIAELKIMLRQIKIGPKEGGQ